MNYPDDIDKELIPLLDTLNSLEGVSTLFSCSGHEKLVDYDGINVSDFYICLKSVCIKSVNTVINAVRCFNDNIEKHGYIMYIEFGITGNDYVKTTDMDNIVVSIRCRKCHLPVKFEHLEEFKNLIMSENESNKQS